MQYCIRVVDAPEESFLSLAAPLDRGYEVILFNTSSGAQAFADWYEEQHGRPLAVFPWMNGGPVR